MRGARKANAGAGVLIDGAGVRTKTYWSLVGLLALGLAGLAFWPQGDLAVARLFWSGGRFVGKGPTAETIRLIGWYLPFAVPAFFAFAWTFGRLFRRWPGRWTPSGRALAFLALSMALGPGLVVNGVLKEQSHRPRPAQTREFGGPWTSRPLYRFDGQCGRNCSFVSGETASAFWMVAPASLAPPPFRAAAVAGALVFGAAVGALRMAFGGHYLSDVLAAALIALFVVAAIRRMLLRARS